MNTDEIKNAITTVVLLLGSSWAGSHGIDPTSISGLVGDIVTLGAGIYSIVNHWNMIKVPERLPTTITPPPSPPKAPSA